MESDTTPKGQRMIGKDRVVIVLGVAVILLSTVIATMILDDLDLFEQPYPSEDTELELVNGKIVWTQELSHGMLDNETFDYRDLRLKWQVTYSDGGVGRETLDELANYTLLSSGSQVTVTRNMTVIWLEDGIQINDVQMFHVTDLLGNGLFEMGDYITFDFGEYRIPEDCVHTIALADVESEWNQEISFAVHDGNLYSWESNDFPFEYPWWASEFH